MQAKYVCSASLFLIGHKLAAFNSNTAVQQRSFSIATGFTRAQQEAADKTETAVSISISITSFLLRFNAQLGHDQCKPELGLTGFSDSTSICWFQEETGSRFLWIQPTCVSSCQKPH